MLQKRLMIVLGLVIAISMVLDCMRTECHSHRRPGRTGYSRSTPWRLAG